jgi:signal peptidase I
MLGHPVASSQIRAMETPRNHCAEACPPREFSDIARCLSYSPSTGGIFMYTGPSMHPTFTAHDILYVKPYGATKMLPGDVIVFQPDGVPGFVVHRIVCVTGDSGIRTRGDNNDCIDELELKPDQILGRVVRARGRDRVRRIHGGLIGKIAAVYVSLRKRLRRTLSLTLRKPYYGLALSGAFHWVGDRLETKVVAFQLDGLETELHLFIRGRFVGRWPRGGRKWEIKQPFRLFINEKLLPTPDPIAHQPRDEESPLRHQ